MSKDKSGNWFARHKILTVVIAVIILGGIAAAASGGDSNTADQSPQQTATDSNKVKKSEEKKVEPSKERLTLDKGWKLDKSNPYLTQVTGTVSNNSDDDISGYIQITFSAYDAEDANVGDCLANANTVDAHGKWKFEAMCSGDGIKTVKFKELTGF